MRIVKKISNIFTSFILLVILNFSSAYAQAFAIVANPSAPDISVEDVKKIYLGIKKTLPDGTPALPLIVRGMPRELFVVISGLTKSQFIQYWMKKIVDGEATPPKEVELESQAVEIIKREKGAITVIPLHKAKEEGLKILLIIE